MMNIKLTFQIEDYEGDIDMPEEYGYAEGQKDPQDLLLTPGELGAAFVDFLRALNAKGQLHGVVIEIPWYSEDGEDIAGVIKDGVTLTATPMPAFRFMGVRGEVRSQS